MVLFNLDFISKISGTKDAILEDLNLTFIREL